MRGLERLDDVFLGNFLRACLDHHDPVAGAGHHQIEPAVAPLLERRVDHELAVDEADADAGDGLRERDRRKRQGSGCAGDRQHVTVVFVVGRQHQRNELGLVTPAGGKQRT